MPKLGTTDSFQDDRRPARPQHSEKLEPLRLRAVGSRDSSRRQPGSVSTHTPFRLWVQNVAPAWQRCRTDLLLRPCGPPAARDLRLLLRVAGPYAHYNTGLADFESADGVSAPSMSRLRTANSAAQMRYIAARLGEPRRMSPLEPRSSAARLSLRYQISSSQASRGGLSACGLVHAWIASWKVLTGRLQGHPDARAPKP